MNLFILDTDLKKSARLLCDQHLNKQILELTQMLSTAGYGVYRSTHKNHPVTKWVQMNLRFSFRYLKILSEEYTQRTGRVHKSFIDTYAFNEHIPLNYEDLNNPFPIQNDLDLIHKKYEEWASRERRIVPTYAKQRIYSYEQ